MAYSIQPMGLRDALALPHWRYDAPYSSYNMSYWDSISICLTQVFLRSLGTSLYYSVHNPEGELVGMFEFYTKGEDTVEVGLGMRPDQTGHGAGLDFVRAGLEYAKDRYRPARFQLEVATFNQRARLVYTRAGFIPSGTMKRRVHGKDEDHIQMSRPA